MRHGGHFWYDGHHGHIKCVGRERWQSFLNGDEFDTGGHPSGLKDDLLTEMKYRQEREPDFYRVCHGVLRFLDQHVPGRNDENDWVLFDSVQNEVILNDHSLAISVMYELEDENFIEITRAYDTPNYQFLLRPNVESVPEPKELSGRVTNQWNEYE